MKILEKRKVVRMIFDLFMVLEFDEVVIPVEGVKQNLNLGL